ncbi:GNAT family N-acetyltransferase [Niabella ginsengisoli]|uniref:GNAT family N-acetyltransferase n=1 Tax=Niabella ginsengisoli TaxID=522298 RepID=A0ABS9SE36_9BACT|nr:GNAT family N-acetyltransferase [Niabella ginsengisoli]MCH5596586.1 GNAT family N-acetyltransferase [Niabella ginsengisoli]
MYDGDNTLVGFGRIITDKATFAYLADVFILDAHRGRGLSKKMVEAFCQIADHFGLRRMMLATQDAHELYKQFGFEQLTNPETIMNRKGGELVDS